MNKLALRLLHDKQGTRTLRCKSNSVVSQWNSQNLTLVDNNSNHLVLHTNIRHHTTSLPSIFPNVHPSKTNYYRDNVLFSLFNKDKV